MIVSSIVKLVNEIVTCFSPATKTLFSSKRKRKKKEEKRTVQRHLFDAFLLAKHFVIL